MAWGICRNGGKRIMIENLLSYRINNGYYSSATEVYDIGTVCEFGKVSGITSAPEGPGSSVLTVYASEDGTNYVQVYSDSSVAINKLYSFEINMKFRFLKYYKGRAFGAEGGVAGYIK